MRSRLVEKVRVALVVTVVRRSALDAAIRRAMIELVGIEAGGD